MKAKDKIKNLILSQNYMKNFLICNLIVNYKFSLQLVRNFFEGYPSMT